MYRSFAPTLAFLAAFGLAGCSPQPDTKLTASADAPATKPDASPASTPGSASTPSDSEGSPKAEGTASEPSRDTAPKPGSGAPPGFAKVTPKGTALVPKEMPKTAKLVHPLGSGRLNSTRTLDEAFSSTGGIGTFLSLAKSCGLYDEVLKSGPYTLFVPTDDAFAKVPANYMDQLRKNKPALKAFLEGMAVKGVVNKAQLLDLRVLPTLRFRRAVKSEDGVVKVDGSQVVKTDIESKVAMVHVLDKVLMPPSAY